MGVERGGREKALSLKRGPGPYAQGSRTAPASVVKARVHVTVYFLSDLEIKNTTPHVLPLSRDLPHRESSYALSGARANVDQLIRLARFLSAASGAQLLDYPSLF